jgi:hypothetical protein
MDQAGDPHSTKILVDAWGLYETLSESELKILTIRRITVVCMELLIGDYARP